MRYLPIAVAGMGGVGLLFLLDSIFASSISIATYPGLLATVLCYFLTGVVAGAWANWRGATNGAWAAGLTWVAIFIMGMVISPGRTINNGVIIILGYFIAVGAGALGGFIGGRIRR